MGPAKHSFKPIREYFGLFCALASSQCSCMPEANSKDEGGPQVREQWQATEQRRNVKQCIGKYVIFEDFRHRERI